MEKRLIVSGGNRIRAWCRTGWSMERSAALEGAGPLCAYGDALFCAGANGILWKLHAQTLMPEALYAGGPGIRSILASPDGNMLYMLCSEADSVLASCTKTGRPLLLNRAGSNPRSMVQEGSVIAVAGGEHGSVMLMSARSLEIMEEYDMPGPVYSVALKGGSVFALCLTQALASVLVTVCAGGERRVIELEGMPGSLLVSGNRILAATEGRLYRIAEDGMRVLNCMYMPGRAGVLREYGNSLLGCDMYGEQLLACPKGNAAWHTVCRQAQDAVVI